MMLAWGCRCMMSSRGMAVDAAKIRFRFFETRA